MSLKDLKKDISTKERELSKLYTKLRREEQRICKHKDTYPLLKESPTGYYESGYRCRNCNKKFN